MYVLAFSQGLEALILDSREVYEYVFAAVCWGDETKTFSFVEPLHLTFDHVGHV
ncbi:cold-shock protein [Serratia marcescens]|nr:cold-shock protein [Serratia marcescens]